MKTVGGFRRTRFLGLARTGLAGYLVAAAYNLVRITRLMQIVHLGTASTKPFFSALLRATRAGAMAHGSSLKSPGLMMRTASFGSR